MLGPGLSATALALVAQSLAAQVPASAIPGPAPSVLFMPNPITFDQVSLRDSVIDSIPPTQWKTGMLIGAGVGGAGLGILTYALCEGLSETDESCLKPALLGSAAGAAIGGVVGALIGGQVSKGTKSEE
jgi:hypothetical protein